MRVATVAVALFALAIPAVAQERADSPRNTIATTGEAVVFPKADLARIDIGVVTRHEGAREAAAQNAAQLERVLAAVRAAAGAGADVKTAGYSLTPEYRHMRDTGEPVVAGYRASNVVRVEMSDLTRVGPVIDAAAQAGSNEIQGLNFTVRNEEAARAQALQRAAESAQAKANALANALGARIGGIYAAEEATAAVRPVYAQAEMMRAGDQAQTPIVPGTIEVRATVRVVFTIVQ